ncbi:SusC/RagA family TonB-linked outer membrane protein [Adhaeribacter aerolatus]|uniref:SusC/RagA family TonB-linked outer membrane protein n=1 Tax=Adhaeribacter aerolatus TaxID=670289 RepID=A0A512B2P7_9BACT|nr:TonB-dependent receptor [Adhaeribacter aerolatus]GEO06037.1 SusC/RagA family TonB-linked outer membrane protein [Adhaeribacter aerolatus]
MKDYLQSKLRHLLLLQLFLSFAAGAWAQNIAVTGRVTDDKGEGLPGVTLLLKGTTNGTTTDPSGNYSLNLPSGAGTLVVSFIGYATQEVPVNNRSNINITLAGDAKALEEVVVVGYGTQRKRDITAAVSNISMEDIGEVPASNVTRLIQGQAPGVAVKQKNGTPGSQFEVRVRGISSLGAGSNPLYVIDGFPVGTSVGQNLNPNEIESITILKDAASTAIYGARGSNGVVLITTKSAKEGKVNLSFSADYGIQNIPDSRKVTVLNGPEFAQFKKEAFIDRYRYVNNGKEPALEEIPLGFRFPEQTKYSTNWYDAILNKNAPYADYNLTLSNGKGPVKSVLALGYFKEEGTIIETNYDRISARANLTGEVNKFITVGLNLNGTYSRQRLANTDGRSAVVGSTLIMDPREPIYDDQGNLRPYIVGQDGVFGFPNPVFMLKNINRKRNIADVLSNAYVDITLLKGLKFRTAANAKVTFNNYNEYVPSTIGLPVQQGASGAPPRIATAFEDMVQTYNLSADQLLTYQPELGAEHHLDFMLGYTAQKETARALSGSANTFPDDLVPYLGAGSIRSAGSSEAGWTLLAYLSRVNYSFKDRYLFSASMRREGSSRFGTENKYGNFPAVSVGWRLSEESFMPKYAWLSDLKLRASWGKTGNNDIGNYSHLAFMNASNYILGNAFAPGKVVSQFANSELRWEKSNQLDLGLDLSLLENKIVFTAEIYRKLTNDMLLPIAIPAVSGFTSSLANIGEVENKGVELGLNFNTRIGQVNFRTSPNITFNRNKILAIKGENDMLWFGGFYGGYNVQKVGRPIGMIYGYRKLGIFNTQAEIDAAPKQDGAIPGSMKFWDADGNGVISYDTKDMVEIGNPNPSFTWGWNFSADYKKFDLSVLFMGAQNYDVYRNIEASTMNIDGVFNVLDKVKDRWRSPENPGSNPNHKNSQGGTVDWKWSRESSGRYVYDASHIWVKNVTLGYALPRFKSYIPDTRIFLNASNLFLITNYPGNNPDASIRGGNELNNDDESYPVPRTFSLGARINF